MTQREEFEAWVREYGNYPRRPELKADDGSYHYLHTESEWRAWQAAQAVQPSQAPCKGTNCGSTDGVNHSTECHAEHDAAANCGTLDTPGNRHPEHRYAGYKGQAIAAGATDDQVAAYQSGAAARVQPSQAGELSDEEILSAWGKHTLANDYEKYTLKEHVLRAGKEIIAAINAKGGK